MTPKTFFIALLIVVVAAAIIAGVWVGTMIIDNGVEAGLSPYTAVYMVSGDIYFGKLEKNPEPHLADTWYLQRNTSGNGPQFGVVPLTSVIWGPSDALYYNPSQVLFTTQLRSDSQLAQALENPNSAASQNVLQNVPAEPVPAGQQARTSTTPTSTKK